MPHHHRHHHHIQSVTRRILYCLGFGLLVACHTSTKPSQPSSLVPSLDPKATAGFQLVERFERRDTLSITATNTLGQTLRLDVVHGLDAESASRMIEDGILSLEALYAHALSPYPGDISNRIITESSFRPRRALGPQDPWFILHANDRLGFGASTREQVRYKALLGWIHCPQHDQLIKVRCFVAPDVPDKTLREWATQWRCHSTSP